MENLFTANQGFSKQAIFRKDLVSRQYLGRIYFNVSFYYVYYVWEYTGWVGRAGWGRGAEEKEKRVGL